MPAHPKKITHNGQTHSLSKWSEITGIPLSTLASRLKKGWSVEDALTKPVVAKFNGRTATSKSPIDPPVCRHHTSSGQARITISIRGSRYERYFGVWGEDATKRAYAAFCRDWIALGPLAALGVSATLLSELVEQYLEYVDREYVKRGRKSSECHAQRSALRPLIELYGNREIPLFGVDQFRDYQRHLASRGYARKTIRDHSNRVLQLIRFGAERGLVSGEQWDRLRAAKKIRRGAGMGKASKKKKPVSDSDMRATFPHLHKREEVRSMLQSMIELQRLIGLRPREICVMRGCDLDQSCDEWLYTVPAEWNKMDHLEREQTYFIGPKAKAILLTLLGRKKNEEYIFVLPGRDAPVEREWYQRRIKSACLQAGIEPWQPHRLRHSKATEILEHTGSFREAAEAIGDTEEVARRNYTDSDAIRRRLARETG